VAWLSNIALPQPNNMSIIATLLLTVSFSWLLYLLIFAVKKYDYTQKHTEKMEW